jgi:glycerol-3-phosphate acyltransferase PlsY
MMLNDNALIFCLLFLMAYLLGSVPWGLIFTRIFAKKDIRKEGSGNIGATNVRRIAGLTPAILTLAADMAKGAVPVGVGMAIMDANTTKGQIFIVLVALAAFMGHLYPCFLKFKGGKGVATAAGCFLMISPLSCLLAILVFILMVMATNRVSLGSLGAALSLAPFVWWMEASVPFTILGIIISVFVFIRHKENIQRLLAGTESTFRTKK